MTLHPILLVWLAMLSLVIGDAAAKIMTGEQALPAFFVAWARFALAFVIVLPFSGFRRDEFKLLLRRDVWQRGLFTTIAIFCLIAAFRTEQLANVFAAFFVAPIIAYVLAAVILGEAISKPRSILLGISFIGVLIAIRPGFGMTIGMLFGLGAGLFQAFFLVSTKSVAHKYRPRFLLVSQFLVGTLVLAPLAMLEPLPSLAPNFLFLALISAAGSAIGNLLLVFANRRIAASVIAPLIYTQLINSIIIGFLVFGDLPDALSFVGLAVIAVSGLLSYRLAMRQQT